MQLSKPIRVATPIIAALFFLAVFLAAPFSYAAPGDETTYYLLTDHLGSVDVVLNENGEVVERRDHLPYGQERSARAEANSPTTDHKFTGKELDPETDLYYYGARYYDPLIGRFVSTDPVILDEGSKPLSEILPNPQALNAYSYVLNNPVKYVDPTGMSEIDVHMYLTTFLAERAGFSEMDAFSIGLYDQLTDSDPNTTPWKIKNSQYHFPTQDNLDSLAMEAIGTLENKAIGRYLHATQDSYAHAGFKASRGGHLWFARLPDKTYLDQRRANIIAEDTFKRLRLLSRLKNGTDGLELNEYNKQTDEIWFQIRDEIFEFSAAKTIDEKLDILGKEGDKKESKDKER